MKKLFVVHPFLLAIFPILSIFSYNLGEVYFSNLLVPILIALAVTSLIYLSLRFALKNDKKAGLITSVFLVLFFLYGHLYNLIYYHVEKIYSLLEILIPLIAALFIVSFLFLFLKRSIKEKKKLILTLSCFFVLVLVTILFFSYGQVFNFIINHAFLKTFFKLLLRHVSKFLSLAWVLFLAVVSYVVIRSKSNFDNLTRYLNAVAIILGVFLFLQIGIYYCTSTGNEANKIGDAFGETILEENILGEENVLANELPDIYYIILDAYGRADVLDRSYSYDNSDFIEMLTDKGFYVASESRCNYVNSFQSVSSTLNMKYLDFLTEELGKTSKDRRIPLHMVKDNEAANFLKEKGYLFLHIASGTGETVSNEYADIEYMYASANFNDFNRLLIETTWLRAIVSSWLTKEWYNRMLYNFEMIEEVPNIKEPTFLFVNTNTPHRPYVFDQQGNFVPDLSKWEDVCKQRQAYIDQLIFINKRVEELIDKILSRSENPPIIILSSDHGVPPNRGEMNNPTETLIKDRVANLNAYYLPNGGDKLLYDSISPVNSFRLIFDYYFDSSYGLLEDKSYFNHPQSLYDFILVPDEESIVWDILKERGLLNQRSHIQCDLDN